jgi:hypothetical protein
LIFTLRTFLVVVFFCSLTGFSIDLRFETGFPKAISFESFGVRLSEFDAVEKVMADEFRMLQNLDWKLSKRQEDSSHVHLTYDLFFQDYPVFVQHLKVHYNKEGYVDYLTSTLRKPVEIPVMPLRNSWEERKSEAAAILFGRASFSGISKGNLGIWLDEEQNTAEWAFDVEAVPRGDEMLKRGIVSVENPRLLEEKKVMRHWSEPEGERATVDLKVFIPFPTGSSGGAVDKNNVSSDDAGKLKNNFVYVRYDRPLGKNYSDVGSTTGITLSSGDNADYANGCTSLDDTCSNQKVDSGNVYYHLTKYRQWIDAKAASLGSEISLAFDPLPVFVNFMAKSIQKCHETDTQYIDKTKQSNNAAYIAGPCDDSGTINRCLVFLRYGKDYPCSADPNHPATVDPGGSFAREALIIAHEYQHYVIDMITGIEFGAANQVRVGDVIHEGYSDYFGASYSTAEKKDAFPTNLIPVKTVGEYAFQTAFESYKRDLGVKKKFINSEAYSDPHTPGWVWASALWELRDTLGSATVDLIALKSLFYLSTTPGFIDSVEALVQADRSVTGGANENRIRTLFFDERKFLGSLAGAFQDADKKILKVGFQGCANANSKSSETGFPTLGVFLLWLISTVWGGKRIWKNR